MASNVTVHNTTVSVISVPTWNELANKADSYPKAIWSIGFFCLGTTLFALSLREYSKNLDANKKDGPGIKGALTRNKSLVNIITYPFADHPLKATLLCAAIYLRLFKS